MATVIIDENTPHDGTEFEAFDEGKTALTRKAAAVNVIGGSGSLNPVWGRGVFSNSAERFAWISGSKELTGPFVANVPTIVTFSGETWYQSEGERTNSVADFDEWVFRGSCTSSAGFEDPLGGTGAYKIEGLDTATGSDLYRIVNGLVMEAPVDSTLFIKRISTSGIVNNNNLFTLAYGDIRIDLSKLSDEWERVDASHPAVTVIHPHRGFTAGQYRMNLRGISGGPLDFYAYRPQSELFSRFPSSPMSHSVTRADDSMVFDTVNRSFYEGFWSTKIIPEHNSGHITGSAGITSYLYWFDANNYLVLTGSGATAHLKLSTDGGAISQSLTYSTNTALTCSVDFSTQTMILEGATTGNGRVSGALSSWPSTGSVYVGSDGTPANHLFGMISEPFTFTMPAHRGVPSDLAEINAFRQGVSISTEAYRLQGAGPKIWAGNIKGYTSVRTIGQTPSFTEVQNSKIYKDQQIFDPVGYVEDDAYPLPIVMNDGPQEIRGGGIRAFALPFWTADNEGSDERAFSVRGNIEDGNQDITLLNGSNSRIRQFVSFDETGNVPFLDEGGSYYGPVATGITTDGYVNDRTEAFVPFDDIGNEKLLDKLSTSDNTLRTALRVSTSINLDNDIRETHGVKSAAAGGEVYGPGQAQYGTDSVTFAGFWRGS